MNSSPPKIRVMVVDDHPVIRRGLTAFLRVVPDLELACEAANGSRALAMLAQSAPDVILMDMVMPEMNGVEFLWQLRQDPRWKQLPVVMITTETSEEIVKEAIELGARGYLRKPFRPEQIRSCLTEIMGGPDAEDLARNDEGCDF